MKTEEKPYHHGNLSYELIEAGIALINEEGNSNFTLRKVAKRVGVSPTACYNHFENKDALLGAMKRHVNNRFVQALKAVTEDEAIECKTMSIGKAYVNFFAKNPNYFQFIYDNDDYHIDVLEDEIDGDYEPFRIFKKYAIDYLDKVGIHKVDQRNTMLLMWSAVHGLAAMSNMRGFHFEGDWEALTETILMNYLKI